MNAPDPSVLHDTLPLVLVVDDEARSLDAIRRNLEEDFRVLTAASADEARGLLEQHEVSVILCDQRMPGTTGVCFLKEVPLATTIDRDELMENSVAEGQLLLLDDEVDAEVGAVVEGEVATGRSPVV